MSLDSIVPLIVAFAALGGLVFTALRFRSEDTSSLVQQHSTVLEGMKVLMDEREEARDQDRREIVRLRAYNERLEADLARERARNQQMASEIRLLRAQLARRGEDA